MNTCELCGEPMPPGEEMFKYHGYSGACPKPPLVKENKMVIGRLHLHDGFVSERTHDAERPIRIGLSHGGDPFNPHVPVVWCELTEAECASLMAHVARRGETGETYAEALRFLQATGIETE